ncbi:MAG TPA: DUF934 domain-containing protein [Burkholderiales bacterium]|nr:DUF934 domain-containing protein [Burkholderiales bacterium]
MATLIKDRRIAADTWRLLDAAEPEQVESEDVIMPLPLWLERREARRARGARLGVWLDSHEGPEAIAADVERFALVAVNFPKYQDGRGYSTARLLRERYGYRGELRAIGQVARDHLHYMASCGFDAFLLRDGEDPQAALAAFGDFGEAYQASVLRPLPLFRRRG